MARVTTLVTMLMFSVWFAGTAEAQTGTAPPGPALNPQQNVGFSDDARQRLIIGVVVVVLAAIVWYGRRTRKKRQKSS
jgi:ABC-type dipeptide/oligopeptide/nickel transport system permease component